MIAAREHVVGHNRRASREAPQTPAAGLAPAADLDDRVLNAHDVHARRGASGGTTTIRWIRGATQWWMPAFDARESRTKLE